MSDLTVDILFIICGLIPLTIRMFFFVDIKDVKELNLKRIKINSFTYITISILSISVGVISLFINAPHYINPLQVIINDFSSLKLYFGLFFIIICIGAFLFREKAIQNWEKNGIRIHLPPSKYRTFALSAGTILLILGLLLII